MQKKNEFCKVTKVEFSVEEVSPVRKLQPVLIIVIYVTWSWANCWPVPVSHIQKSLQRSAMIPSASWRIVFHYPG